MDFPFNNNISTLKVFPLVAKEHQQYLRHKALCDRIKHFLFKHFSHHDKLYTAFAYMKLDLCCHFWH